MNHASDFLLHSLKLPLSLFTTLGPWASFLLVTQTSFSCASDEFLLFFRIIFTMTCIHFLKYWTLGAKWGGAGKKDSVLAHSEFMLQLCICSHL